MSKRWIAAAAVVGAALAGPAAAQTGNPPQQTGQSQAEYERGIHRDPGRHDPAADAARRMENAEPSRAPQPAPAPTRR